MSIGFVGTEITNLVGSVFGALGFIGACCAILRRGGNQGTKAMIMQTFSCNGGESSELARNQASQGAADMARQPAARENGYTYEARTIGTEACKGTNSKKRQ